MCRMPAVRTALCVVLCALGGCTGLGKAPTRTNLQPWPEIQSDFRVPTLRARLLEYSTTFAAEVDLAATAIERRSTDPTVRRNALLWRVRAIPEMRKACFRLQAVSALVDAWTLARQMDQLFSEGAGTGAFGPFHAEAVAVSRRLVDQVRVIGGSIAVSPEARAGFEQRIIDPWLAEYPLRDLTFVRESPIARFAEQTRDPGDLAQSLGTIEELTSTPLAASTHLPGRYAATDSGRSRPDALRHAECPGVRADAGRRAHHRGRGGSPRVEPAKASSPSSKTSGGSSSKKRAGSEPS